MSEDRGPILPAMEEDVTVDRSVEPGSPRLEHVVFVILGVLLTVVIFLRGLGLL